MKKIINKPENVVTEMLDGLAYVHSDLVHRVDGFDIIVRNEQAAVKLVSFLVVEVVMSQPTLVLWVMVCFQQPSQVQCSHHQHLIKFWKLSRKQIKGLVSSWLLKIILGTS